MSGIDCHTYRYGYVVHSHIIVNAVSRWQELNIRNAQYAKMKDIANDLGHQMGLSVLDFRKPAKDRITSAERRIELKGAQAGNKNFVRSLPPAKSRNHYHTGF